MLVSEPRCPTGVIPTVCFDDDVWSGAADDPNPVEFGVRRKTHYTIARGYQGAVMSLVAFTPHQHCPPPSSALKSPQLTRLPTGITRLGCPGAL